MAVSMTVVSHGYDLHRASVGSSRSTFATPRQAGRISILVTCDQASLCFRGGKVRLIQLLDYLSVASPESGLFSDWSMAGNLTHRSSGVQIPCDICTPLKRYLYSAKSSWIIKIIVTPPNSNAFSDWRERVTCHGLNLSNSLERIKLTNSLGKQQVELWTRT